MFQALEQLLSNIHQQQLTPYLKNARTGLEKEGLRVTPAGRLSQRDHPVSLGSALTHPEITTDYSEALLELITPPQASHEALESLLDIKAFVYQHMDDELLWTTSMPCVISGEDDIRIAEYGNSNPGRMKHIYRQGLAWRYGKIMQVIAGAHFNYSIDEAFWPVWKEVQGSAMEERHFRDTHYMGMVRNIQRYGWLIIYLFGASPAICQTFLNNKASRNALSIFKNHTLYEPNGTSLRMGNIGYTNHKESARGTQVCYTSLDKYVNSLRAAINKPDEEYKKIGVKVNGEYRQLNANTLQIENEYYSTVRPKQIMQHLEKPVDALSQRGIRYVELRSLDISPFEPAGLSAEQLAFTEVFLHFCLFQESPPIDPIEQEMINRNQLAVAHHGRAKDLLIQKPGYKNTTLNECANEIMAAMQGVAELLDTAHNKNTYSQALAKQHYIVNHPEETPSARVLDEMQENYPSFFDFALDKAQQHKDFFMQRTLSNEANQRFESAVKNSLAKQIELETKNDIPFDDFLANYFNDSLS